MGINLRPRRITEVIVLEASLPPGIRAEYEAHRAIMRALSDMERRGFFPTVTNNDDKEVTCT